MIRFHFKTRNLAVEVSHHIAPGPVFDVGGTIRVFGDLGFGLSVTRFHDDSRARVAINLSVPSLRSGERLENTAHVAAARTETAIHFQWIIPFPIRGNLQIAIFGGPSLYQVNQQTVRDVLFTETESFSSEPFSPIVNVEITDTEFSKVTRWVWGPHAGVDTSYYPSKHFGVGVLVRLTRATAELENPLLVRSRLSTTPPSLLQSLQSVAEPISVSMGGLPVSAGLRVRFP